MVSFNPKPEAMAGTGMDRLHEAPTIASGFGLNEEVDLSTSVSRTATVCRAPSACYIEFPQNLRPVTTLGAYFVVNAKIVKSQVCFFVVCTLLHAAALRAASEDFKVTEPRADLKVNPFYKKYISAGGYPVVASEKVSDYALKEAAFLVNMMLAKRPDVREAMIKSGSRLIVMAHSEFTIDMPEHAHMQPKDYWDARARGLGGSRSDPMCSCGEENLLGYPGDPYEAECILIHEFAHNIHLRGLVNLDSTFDDRLEHAYDAAMAQGLWKAKYASVNHHEYWAEGVQSWFDNNRPPDHDHNHVNTRKELKEYDAGLAKLCEEVFGDTELAYTKPATRLDGHLAGYDPSKAPTFRWPERLGEVREEIIREARNRGKRSEPKTVRIEHQQQKIEGWTVHVDKRLLSDQHEAVGGQALRILTNKLYEIALVVPDERLARLREVPIWMDLDHPLKNLQYHPNAGWLRNHGYDPAMAKAVHIPVAERLIDHQRNYTQPWAVLHELAHAYHDRELGFDHEPIQRAYEQVVESKRYESVLHVGGRKRRHYALSNHKELFAEMTEAYFGTNDFYPFVRVELQECDPEVFSLLARIWSQEQPAPSDVGEGHDANVKQAN